MTAHVIHREDMVACKIAFIDCKMPGSDLKENYSLIGAGVTQSADQVVNITEPHGFSVGAAAMPPGTTNNLHVHFTAEVFMVHSGTWVFRWGAEGRDGEIVGGPGDIVSVPTWIFRGFSNIGNDSGWIFTALGGDDTGGIIWHPSILRGAAQHGLYLTRDNMMVDTAEGHAVPPAEELMPPLDDETVARMRRFSPAQMRERVVTPAELAWSGAALMDSALPGHAAELAPVIGHGMSQDLLHTPKVSNPHGFSVEWLRIAPGQQVGPFQLAERQVLMVFEGAIAVVVDDGAAETAESREVVSVPPSAWRTITSTGAVPAMVVVVTAGEHKKHAVWPAGIVAQARALGIGVDHSGYLAPLRLLPHEMRSQAA